MRVALALTCLLAVAPALAQLPTNLGELLDQGAVRLSAAEVRSMGDVRVLRRAVDADAYMTLRADGTVVGMVHNKQGHGSSEAVGRWELKADGQRCSDVELPAFRMAMQQCGYTYRLGKDIYFAPSEADRAAPVTVHAGSAFLQ